MKKTLFIAFILLISVINICQAQPTDEIKMDAIPVLQVNQHPNPKTIEAGEGYNATLIAPSQTDKPALNFNLSNIKNVKKGAILPNENIDKSLSNVTQYFNAPYDKVFSHLIGIVEDSELELVSYDSSSGRIFANYKHEKPIFINVSQYNASNVMVKITPADGIYDLPNNITGKIFMELNNSLEAK